jgi:hypothetical protein
VTISVDSTFLIIDHVDDLDWDRARYECQSGDSEDRYADGPTPELALWQFIQAYGSVRVVPLLQKLVSKDNRRGESFCCTSCGHAADADTVGAVNGLVRTRQLLGSVESPRLKKQMT